MASKSKLESFARGASQGATFSWGDELSAALGALASTATDKELGRGYGDRYEAIRDQIRAENEAAQKDNPYTYLGGELTGGAATAAPFAGELIASQGLNTLAKGGKAAMELYGMSALQGAGETHANDTGGMIQAAHESGMTALKSPLYAADKAADVSRDILTADVTGAGKDAAQMALLLTPLLALKGGKGSLNEFVGKRYTQDVAKMEGELAKELSKGKPSFEKLKSIRDWASQHIDDFDNAWNRAMKGYEVGEGGKKVKTPKSKESLPVLQDIAASNVGLSPLDRVKNLKIEAREALSSALGSEMSETFSKINQRGATRDEVRKMLGFGEGFYTTDNPWNQINGYVYGRLKEDPQLTASQLAEEVRQNIFLKNKEGVTPYKEFAARREGGEVDRRYANELASDLMSGKKDYSGKTMKGVESALKRAGFSEKDVNYILSRNEKALENKYFKTTKTLEEQIPDRSGKEMPKRAFTDDALINATTESLAGVKSARSELKDLVESLKRKGHSFDIWYTDLLNSHNEALARFTKGEGPKPPKLEYMIDPGMLKLMTENRVKLSNAENKLKILEKYLKEKPERKVIPSNEVKRKLIRKIEKEPEPRVSLDLGLGRESEKEKRIKKIEQAFEKKGED